MQDDSIYEGFSEDRLSAAKLLHSDVSADLTAVNQRCTQLLSAYLLLFGIVGSSGSWLSSKFFDQGVYGMSLAAGTVLLLIVGTQKAIQATMMKSAQSIDDPCVLLSHLKDMRVPDFAIRARIAVGLCISARSIQDVIKQRRDLVNQSFYCYALTLVFLVFTVTTIYATSEISKMNTEIDTKAEPSSYIFRRC